MHDVAQREVAEIYQETCFLPGLATHGCSCCLAPVDMSGDDAVVTVFVPRVFPSEQEHPLVLEEQQVCLRDKFETLHRSLQCADPKNIPNRIFSRKRKLCCREIYPFNQRAVNLSRLGVEETLPALRSTLARRSGALKAGILFDTCLAFTFYSRRTFEGVKMRLGVRQEGRCLTRGV